MRGVIDIGNKKLEVQVEGNGSPSVVILPGMGCSIDEWYSVMKALKETTQLILPQRSGLGESEIVDEKRTTCTTALELNTLLKVLDVTDKVILVGHSYGGLCVQHFVKLYPEKVCGAVLIDSTSIHFNRLNELDLPTLNEEDTDEKWIEMCKKYSRMTKEELTQHIKPALTDKETEFPQKVQQRLLDFQVNPNLYKAMGSEVENWGKDAIEIRNLGAFPNIPLTVIGRDMNYTIDQQVKNGLPEWEVKELEHVWQELIKEQVYLSKKGKFIIAKNAGHAIHIERPDVVIDAIRSLL